jgi:NADH dehydrogenase
MHRVVVIGAGFGGLAAARRLAGVSVDVTLIDQHNYHTFQPLLYEVATAGLDATDVAYPIRASIGRSANLHFRLGEVTGIDLEERTVCFAGTGKTHDATSDDCADDIPFDSLVVATGAVVNFFGVLGATSYAHPLYTVNDARHLRDHILLRLEEADGERAHASDGTLTFVVVGGGPTGVEVSGAIVELLDMSMVRDGFRFDRSLARVILIDGFDHVLSTFTRSAQHYAKATLESRSVVLRLGEMVAKIGPDSACPSCRGGAWPWIRIWPCRASMESSPLETRRLFRSGRAPPNYAHSWPRWRSKAVATWRPRWGHAPRGHR